MFLKKRGPLPFGEDDGSGMSEFLVKGLIKTDKYDASNDPTKMEASIALFDDLFETYDAVNSKMEGVDEDQWRTILHS